MKVIIAGGRDFQSTGAHRGWLIRKLEELRATEIVCGMATGADLFGKEISEALGLPVSQFPADWNLYGNRAGPIRNSKMAKYADACILFPGGKGTRSMFREARKEGLPIYTYRVI